MQNLQSAVGVFAMLAIAWVISEDRRGVAWKQTAIGLLVTFATAVILVFLLNEFCDGCKSIANHMGRYPLCYCHHFMVDD